MGGEEGGRPAAGGGGLGLDARCPRAGQLDGEAGTLQLRAQTDGLRAVSRCARPLSLTHNFSAGWLTPRPRSSIPRK